MKFKTSTDLKKWMTAQDKAGKLTGELHTLATYVLGHWRIIERKKKAGKTIDARSARFFKDACERLDDLLPRGDAGSA